ncbi:type III secretion system cytoplasmic ring protein SctQ [Achromobacter sp. Bel]|uniref:type III secretion system cytoplasmic ring protein SctQ n=1 Tax=Achromobacter sp. Bel TaxID=2727415 RepID=UPI00145CEF4B|nr:type III secretion system cytoplasmic ring protein SctQ [Achromobacter sp. Bel]NMK50029.1 type III secretion system cytoplasmic ring protein SctQ [Achromobacter sp. Bel]
MTASPPSPLFSLPLPRLSGNEARARSLIARHGADLRVTLAPLAGADAEPSDWRIGFTPGVPDALRQSASLTADIEWAGARLRLGLPASAVHAWLAARLPGLDAGEVPAPLIATAIETLLAEVMAGLADASPGGPAHIVSRDAPAAPLPQAWTIAARHPATGGTVFASLESDGLGLMLLAGLVSQAEPAVNDIDTDAVPVRVAARLGWTDLPATELAALQPRDTIFLDHYLVSPDGELCLAAGGQGLRVRQENASYLITQSWKPLMTETPQPSADAGPDAQAPLDIDAIPVRLTFELGERQFTLGDLRRLQPGETFDLERPLAEGPVIVRANGAFVGAGELVEIDGRVGVTLTRLGKAGA